MLRSASSQSWTQYRSIFSEWVLPDFAPKRTLRRRLWPIALAVAYVATIALLGGLRPDHVGIASLVLLDSYNRKTRLFLRCFLPFILTGVAFDSMRYFYWAGVAGHIHVTEPYFRDRAWFGISSVVNGVHSVITPNEFFAQHTWVVLDLLCGFAYLTYVSEYLLTAFFLFFDGQTSWLRRFGACFFSVNVMGFITYFIYPAAPPWYVSQYGLGPARMDIQPAAAAASRFDQILGTHFFDDMYGHGIDVFGAYPSLHVCYPFLVVLAAFTVPKLKMIRVPAIAFYLLMCLSAVYLQHHYVVDVLLGTLYAIVAWFAVTRIWPVRSRPVPSRKVAHA